MLYETNEWNYNTVIGHKAGLNINTAGTGGTNNVIIGFNAGAEIEGGEYNICIGSLVDLMFQ